MNVYLYGPPGSGKTTIGRALAKVLELPFIDMDREIEKSAGMDIPQIFAAEGEQGFREREVQVLKDAANQRQGIIALGGGALLNKEARAVAESSGQVLCLQADMETLLSRVNLDGDYRPLLAGDPSSRLVKLLESRGEHYRSFPLQLDTTHEQVNELVGQALQRINAYRVQGMGNTYTVRIAAGGLESLGSYLSAMGLKGPAVLVSDRNVGGIYQERIFVSLQAAGWDVSAVQIEAGEEHKNLDMVQMVWEAFIRAGVERGSTIIAMGGGVVGDLSGFAAATFLRGVAWVNLPTSLLAMVDSSLGGKTGIDLPQAKNLVGAFYPPRLVIADPQVLETLPARELRGGLAEVVKHGIIGDPDLFSFCAQGWEAVTADLQRIVRQGMAVKLGVIEADPYEKDLRQALNLGHTIGHGVEIASDFQLSHGEAVAIGTAAEARLAEKLGIAEQGLADAITAVLEGVGLPVTIPRGISPARIVEAMQLDKKRAAGRIRFALPVRVGEVRTGVEVENWQQMIFDL
jgi:shikimate kinase / 3-dehydroquinate synthase